mmetsp:Transcript_35064/g.91764  ORF Transcript_35064/g.91764 Transcript_35064/m.91764 type:complete len:231 (-) Transcript_35064:207-899(-)
MAESMATTAGRPATAPVAQNPLEVKVTGCFSLPERSDVDRQSWGGWASNLSATMTPKVALGLESEILRSFQAQNQGLQASHPTGGWYETPPHEGSAMDAMTRADRNPKWETGNVFRWDHADPRDEIRFKVVDTSQQASGAPEHVLGEVILPLQQVPLEAASAAWPLALFLFSKNEAVDGTIAVEVRFNAAFVPPKPERLMYGDDEDDVVEKAKKAGGLFGGLCASCGVGI